MCDRGWTIHRENGCHNNHRNEHPQLCHAMGTL